jgi:hypothetical protein
VISFRYHLVSIIALFLALALGVVIGTTALNGAVVGDLRRQVSDLSSANSADSDQIKSLQAAAGNGDQLAKLFRAKITGGTLTGIGVELLSAPGTSAQLAAAVGAQITAAGGAVAGSFTLEPDLFDPRRAGDVRSFATSGIQPLGLQLPQTGDSGALAGALIGYVLLGRGQGTDLSQVLSGFRSLRMLKASGTPAAGKVIVLLAPGGEPKDDPATKSMLSFATQLGATGPTIVAGDSASARQNGLVYLIRGTSAAKTALSTVDDVDGTLGQLTVALVVADAVPGRKGHYGTAPGVDSLLPDTGR